MPHPDKIEKNGEDAYYVNKKQTLLNYNIIVFWQWLMELEDGLDMELMLDCILNCWLKSFIFDNYSVEKYVN